MKKIMQIVTALIFVTAANGYGWEWPDWRAWFTPKVNSSYIILDKKTSYKKKH